MPTTINYPSNSRHAKVEEKDEPKKVEKIITGSVAKRKKSLGKKFSETFLGDNINNVFSYIFLEVLLPAAKSTLNDMVSGGFEQLLYGDGKRARPSSNKKAPSYVSYSSYYKSDQRNDRQPAKQTRSARNFDDIVLETRGEAEGVLDYLLDLISNYDVATVGDLYDLVGIAGEHTDNKYGWTNLSTASVSRVKDGYMLNLPKVLSIE